jgi:acetoacetyl-CoA synthetase
MSVITEGTLLWEPSAAVKKRANLTHYMDWLQNERGLAFQSYPELWQWSVTDLEGFGKVFGTFLILWRQKDTQAS